MTNYKHVHHLMGANSVKSSASFPGLSLQLVNMMGHDCKITFVSKLDAPFELKKELYIKVSKSYLYPSIKDIVLWLNRVHVLALVKVISCYHDNRRCIKFFSKIVYLSRKLNWRSEIGLDCIRLGTLV